MHIIMRTWDTGYSVANAESLKETDSSTYQSPDPLKKKTFITSSQSPVVFSSVKTLSSLSFSLSLSLTLSHKLLLSSFFEMDHQDHIKLHTLGFV